MLPDNSQRARPRPGGALLAVVAAAGVWMTGAGQATSITASAVLVVAALALAVGLPRRAPSFSARTVGVVGFGVVTLLLVGQATQTLTEQATTTSPAGSQRKPPRAVPPPVAPSAPTASATSPAPTAPSATVPAAEPSSDSGTRVTTLSEVHGYLPNPGIGYQGWTHAIGALEQSTEYRRGEHPQQGGFDWASLNPADGVYDWSAIDGFLDSVAARGEQGSFRVYTMNGESYGINRVPQWVKDAGAIIRDTVDLEPDYRSRQYQEHWGRFVDALAARYDGDPRIAFIDISGYGRYNEWQANPFTDMDDAVGQNDTLDSSTRRHLVHAFVGGEGVARVLESDGVTEGTTAYQHPGFRRTQLVMPYGGMWASTRYVLDNYAHVGFRNDALFTSHVDVDVLGQIGHGITDVWRTAPVVFETVGPAGSGDWDRAETTVRGMGASLLHDSANPDARDALSRLVAPLGYRYLCQQVQSPTTVASGGSLALQTTWTNTGTARAYPRMGQDFTVSFALADQSGKVVTSWGADEAVSDWLPGEQHVVTTTATLPQLAAGDYQVLVGIAQRGTGERIQLPLTTDRTDEWYPAARLRVA